jgi:hypothetical protein
MMKTISSLMVGPGNTVLRFMVILSLFGVLSLTGAASTGLQLALEETAADMEKIWPEGACESIFVQKKGHPLTSIACSGNFDRANRAKFLDVLFRHDFVLKRETYRLQPKNGMYLYKTVHAGRLVYFKLFVRNARDLWPQNPVQGKQLALYVQNIRTEADLLKWRTLGVPLTYGITYGRSDTQDLVTKLAQYGDEIWLAIPLEDERIEIADGNLLSISDALDPDKLAEYLRVPDDEDQTVRGISSLYCSRFCKNVPALRALFTAFREKSAENDVILLDADPHEQSSFYETGRIMNFRTFRAIVTMPQRNNFCPQLTSYLAMNSTSASRIMAVDAADLTAFQCLKALHEKNTRDLEFVKISQLSLTNPFR